MKREYVYSRRLSGKMDGAAAVVMDAYDDD